jgi:DNA-binding transcriptional MerR regulator
MKSVAASPQYTIGQLAELAQVSRRTVHFYVQQSLIDAPEGRGRGSYYTAKHLEQLQRVLRLQREGLPLRRIQAMPEAVQVRAVQAAPDRQLVLRLAVAPGITLELAAGDAGQLPSASQLQALARRCAEILKKN